MVETLDPSLAAPKTPSIDADEVAKFSAMAEEWWDPTGKFKPLHKFNPVRLRYIREMAERHFGIEPNLKRPLAGLRVLDIGCGGGLVSEPMARLGAEVVAVDASEANIKTAMTHAKAGGLNIDFRAGTAEGLIESGEPPFDIVLNLEVVEHVANPAQFIADTSSLVRPGGVILVATINRTAKAFALAIVGAEYVMRWLPRGTHEFDKFLKPREIDEALAKAGMQTQPPQGVFYNPLADSWRLSDDHSVNYMIMATKPPIVNIASPDAILDYWFGDAAQSAEACGKKSKLWFGKSDETDAEIIARFSGTISALTGGVATDWASEGARQRLAAIVALDQFSRNAFRGTHGAFANDPLALSLALDAIDRGEDKTLSEPERAFLYLPLEHAEDPDMQARSVAKFEELVADARADYRPICEEWLDYARRHKAVIDAFGRFPHRNEILGRTSTPQELDYLSKPGAGF